MSDTEHTEVTIVGAGISGLSIAYFLTRAGLDVRVIEKNDRTGGTIESKRIGDFLIDYGPNSALETTPLLAELFAGVGIAGDLCYANELAKNRYILKNGRLHALPMSPGALITSPLFSLRAKLRLLQEPFIPKSNASADESLAAFVARRLGPEFLDYAINPFVSGVYAGVPESLSVRSSFPKLHALEQRYGSLIKGAIKGMKERRQRRKRGDESRASAKMFSFTAGMQTVVDALSRKLVAQIRTGAVPVAVERTGDGFTTHVSSTSGMRALESRAVVFAIPAYAYGEVEFAFPFPLGEALNHITYPPVTVVFFGYQGNPVPRTLDGFGFLVPQKEARSSLGTIWSSALFPQRAPDGGVSLTTFVGGSRQPENARLQESAVVDIVRGELQDIMGITAAPDVVAVRRWDRAIPQYNIGHTKTIAAIEAFESDTPRLYVAGNFRGGVSIADCVRHAHDLSERVTTHLRSTIRH